MMLDKQMSPQKHMIKASREEDSQFTENLKMVDKQRGQQIDDMSA
jgi:hypothetical protein